MAQLYDFSTKHIFTSSANKHDASTPTIQSTNGLNKSAIIHSAVI
jgi:hypothetical protein